MIRVFFLLLMGLLVSSCNKHIFVKVPSPLKKITIAYTYQPQCTLIHVAKEKGFFAEEGLDVVPLMHQYGKTALRAVLENEADLATVAETPLLFSILNDDKIFILSTIVVSSKNSAIIARKDADINTANELKGKKIGVTPLTTGDFFLDSLLLANGMTRKDIVAVPVRPDDMEEALKQRKIDAASTWNYPLTQIKHLLGENGILFFDEDIYTETFNLASKQDFVTKNPEVIKQLLKAVVKAQEYVKNHPKEAQEIMARVTSISPDLIKEVWDAFSFNVTLDQTILITLEDEARWAIKNKLTDKTKVPDFKNFIYADALKSVSPSAYKLNRVENEN